MDAPPTATTVFNPRTASMKRLSSWFGFHWRGRSSSLMTRLCTPGMLTVRWNSGVLPSGVPLS
jgi:hypothetical protein